MKHSSPLEQLYSVEQIHKYSAMTDRYANELKQELLGVTVAELVLSMKAQFTNEQRKCNWHEVLAERIKDAQIGEVRKLPSSEECELFEQMLVFMDEIQSHHKQVLERKLHEHSRVISSMQFEQRTSRISADRTCQLLKDELAVKSNSLLAAWNQLAQERQEARSTKQNLASEISRLKDEICLKDSTINELNRRLRQYGEQLQEMEKVVQWADYSADVLRLQTYSLGLEQQEQCMHNHLKLLQSALVRERMHEALYKYVEHVHNQAIGVWNLSFNQEKQAFERSFRQPLGDDNGCKMIWECQQAVARVGNLSKHRYESLLLAHEQRQLEWGRDLAKKEHSWNVQRTATTAQIRQLENELKVQGQQLAKLVALTSHLEGDSAREKNHNIQLQRQLSLVRHQLQTAEADIKVLRAVAKNLEESNESLRVEKTSLRENLLLISQTSNRQKQSLEEQSMRQKGIVEQVVERNFQYKLRNRQLEAELNQLRDNYDRLRNDLESDAKQYSQINDNLRKEVLSKNDTIERLKMDNEDKENYIHQVNEKIQVLEGQLTELEELHNCNSQLSERCRDSQMSLVEAAEREELLQREIKKISQQKTSLEAQNLYLKEKETIVIEHSKKSKADEERIISLSEELESALQQIKQLQQELSTANKCLATSSVENSQLKDKMIALMEEKRTSTCKNEALHPDTTNFGRDMNLEETLKAKQNISSGLKEKYTQSILNLNQLVNFLMNCAKGYTFTGESRVREGSWIWQQGPTFLKKMQSTANLQGKLRNYLRVRQLANNDPKIRQVCDTFCGIMDGYYQRLRQPQLN